MERDGQDTRRAAGAAGLAAVSCPFFAGMDALFLWSALVYGALLLGAAREDWRTGYISDGWSAALALLGGVRWTLCGAWEDLLGAAGVCLFFGALVRLPLRAAGEGDLFLAGAAALWLSWRGCALFLWGAFAAGGLFGAALVLAGRKRFADSLPFAPFLAGSAFVSYLWGGPLWEAWLALP